MKVLSFKIHKGDEQSSVPITSFCNEITEREFITVVLQCGELVVTIFFLGLLKIHAPCKYTGK